MELFINIITLIKKFEKVVIILTNIDNAIISGKVKLIFIKLK